MCQTLESWERIVTNVKKSMLAHCMFKKFSTHKGQDPVCKCTV